MKILVVELGTRSRVRVDLSCEDEVVLIFPVDSLVKTSVCLECSEVRELRNMLGTWLAQHASNWVVH